jgi:hypothetical protein
VRTTACINRFTASARSLDGGKGLSMPHLVEYICADCGNHDLLEGIRIDPPQSYACRFCVKVKKFSDMLTLQLVPWQIALMSNYLRGEALKERS